jgi:ABC-2 type transport system permease protein
MLLALQYRAEFLIDGLLTVFWTLTALIPLWVVFHDRPSVAGWSYPEALLVVAWFTMLQALLEGAVNPSLSTVVEHIRKGTLDFVLLKPVDAQFLVSTSRFLVWKGVHVLTAIGIATWAFHLLGHGPSAMQVLLALLLWCAAVAVVYSLWILVVSAAFFVVRIDNLNHFLSAVMDAARWPIGVFQGFVRFVFTFVLPLALMTTYPAQALLGTLGPGPLYASLAGGALFAWLARTLWKKALLHYTSASS